MTTTLADATDQKEAFALQLLLTHGDALKAALSVSANKSYALFIAEVWPDDLYVIQCRERLLTEHGAAFFLPSKYDIAHRIVEVADRALTAEDRLKAYKLYADLMGFVEKPGVNVNNTVVNKVMVVQDHGSDDDWERKALAQQRTLVEHATG